MTVGIAHYSASTGAMKPHNHAEETVFVVDAQNAWIRYGPSPDGVMATNHVAPTFMARS